MPDSPDYFDRLTARLEASTDLDGFMQNELAMARASLMVRNQPIAIRRIAFSALWQPIIPFELMASVTPNDISPLLAAEDPFSLLFGFEICRASLEKDAGFTDLGAAFLAKLFGDRAASQRRFETFTACALVAVIAVRQAAKAASVPVFWARLAALTHAGVIADALERMPNTKDFLRWATQNFLPSYVRHSVVDRREAPRWKPEWISPDHIFAELVGRARGTLYMLPEENRPASWISAIEAATERLIDDGDMVKAIFPGPFDDFRQSQTGLVLAEAAAEVEARLGDATRLNDMPGFVALTFTAIPSQQAILDVLRILSLTAEDLSTDIEDDLRCLQIVAHFALAARSEAIAQAVIDRCFLLTRSTGAAELVTDLFAVIVEACAVHGTGRKYREALGQNAARMCFMIDGAENLSKLEAILGVLVQRDEKLAPALAKARAVVRTRRGRM